MRTLVAAALMLAACADNVTPEEDRVIAGAETDRRLWAGFAQELLDCADHTVQLRGHWGYSDGTRPTNYSCRFTLADGTVLSDECFAVPSLADPTAVTFTVTDHDTGQVATYSEVAQGPASFEATVDLATDGLTLSWDAHTFYGSVVDDGSVLISISPPGNVIVSDPDVLTQLAGMVSVTEPGIYTVGARASMRFPDVGGCGAHAEATIEVACD